MAADTPLRSPLLLPLLLLLATLAAPSSAARSFGGLVLPPVVYGTEGIEGNIYFDNISPSRSRDFEYEF